MLKTIQMNIPIQNIYYLLCYAWNKLEEKEKVDVDAEDFQEIYDLFAKVLANGCSYLLKRGFDRNYIEYEDSIPGIKGKLLLSESIKQNLFHKSRALCVYDDFSHNIIHNQIIKSTIRTLLLSDILHKDIRSELHRIYRMFHGIDEIKLSRQHFGMVRLHRNNYFYDLLLKICRVIYDNLLVSEAMGEYKFVDFVIDPRKMNQVFEKFVFNFYRIHFPEFKVKRDTILWKLKAEGDSDITLLPQMNTDISVYQQERILIIDTKFYSETLSYNYDKHSIHSANLYQLFAYLENFESDGRKLDGMLLYPVVDREIDEDYSYKDHKVMIRTIDLDENWRSIDKRLRAIIE